MGHRQKVMTLDVVIEPLCDYLLQDLARAFKKADRSICFRYAVVRFLGLVNDNDGGLVPWVDACF